MSIEAWPVQRSTQRSGQRHLSSTLAGAENGRPALKKSADVARREDLELIRSFKNQLGASSSQVQADWKDHIAFERKVGQLMAGKVTKISSVDGQPVLSSGPTFIQQLLRTIVATYNGLDGKRNPRFLTPADQQGWLWGVKQPLIRSFDERDEHLTIEMLTPESRRAVLWTARVMLSDKVRRFRHRQGFNATFMCKRCVWATLVDQLATKERVSLGQMAASWPPPIRDIVFFSPKATSTT